MTEISQFRENRDGDLTLDQRYPAIIRFAQFQGELPGVFLRGDYAKGLSDQLNRVLDILESLEDERDDDNRHVCVSHLRGLANTLASALNIPIDDILKITTIAEQL